MIDQQPAVIKRAGIHEHEIGPLAHLDRSDLIIRTEVLPIRPSCAVDRLMRADQLRLEEDLFATATLQRSDDVRTGADGDASLTSQEDTLVSGPRDSIQDGELFRWQSPALTVLPQHVQGLGVILLALIGNGFNLLNASPFLRDLTTGVVIIFAVALAARRRA